MARTRFTWRILGVTLAVAGIAGWLLVGFISAHNIRTESARLATVLEVREGSRVADVGAGSGDYALELARLVGSTGHVFATELDDMRLREIQSAAEKAGLQHLSVVEAGEADTRLEPGCCDAILMRSVYHHVTRPSETNASLYRALLPGGRLAVVDFRPNWFLSTFFRVKDVPENRGGHGVLPDVVIDELEVAGFTLARRIDQWDGRLYCLVFQKPAASY